MILLPLNPGTYAGRKFRPTAIMRSNLQNRAFR